MRPTKETAVKAETVKKLLQRPIAFHRVFAEITGSATSGLFLSQLFYWHDKGDDPNGWIYKTREEWRRETYLNRYEQEKARDSLKRLGLLEEERRGLPARLYYRLNVERLVQMLNAPFEFAVDEDENPIQRKFGG